ncbi:hypothetical protein NQ176_g9068 [Zarea fungicola]|uniref:Uncharacterized protein n=1 Tax=Zarea fungicola TaxID=93591 RepID=A0ACC1MQW9_9HYPO|nr:hypothetical protein NQ176_g9068 [Lecanicillium fungicola]
MSAHFGSNINAVRVADRKHVNPILEGILYTTDRKAQVAILQNESRRTSTSSSSSFFSRKNSSSSRKNSAISPDTISVASYEKEKKKKSLFGMSSHGRNHGVIGRTNIM